MNITICIGGPADGRRVMVEPSHTTYHVQTSQHLDIDQRCIVKVDSYRIYEWPCQGYGISLGIHESLTVEDGIKKFTDAYPYEKTK